MKGSVKSLLILKNEKMFYKYRKGINLSGSDVEVNYTRYINNYKKDLQLNDKTIGEAVEGNAR